MKSFFHAFFPVTCIAFFLVGCESSTAPGESGGELSLGNYLVLTDSDDLYQYEQYFVVQSGHRWEFVEYGFLPGSKNLCQASRQRGTYSATDSTLTLTIKGAADSYEKCGMTKAQFDAIPFQTAPDGLTQVFKIRSVSTTGFEGYQIFDGTPAGWFRYAKKQDPVGFF